MALSGSTVGSMLLALHTLVLVTTRDRVERVRDVPVVAMQERERDWLRLPCLIMSGGGYETESKPMVFLPHAHCCHPPSSVARHRVSHYLYFQDLFHTTVNWSTGYLLLVLVLVYFAAFTAYVCTNTCCPPLQRRCVRLTCRAPRLIPLNHSRSPCSC